MVDVAIGSDVSAAENMGDDGCCTNCNQTINKYLVVDPVLVWLSGSV